MLHLLVLPMASVESHLPQRILLVYKLLKQVSEPCLLLAIKV